MNVRGDVRVPDGPDYLALDRIGELCPEFRERLEADDPDPELVVELFDRLGTEIAGRGWPCLAAVLGLVARWPEPHRAILDQVHA